DGGRGRGGGDRAGGVPDLGPRAAHRPPRRQAQQRAVPQRGARGEGGAQPVRTPNRRRTDVAGRLRHRPPDGGGRPHDGGRLAAVHGARAGGPSAGTPGRRQGGRVRRRGGGVRGAGGGHPVAV